MPLWDSEEERRHRRLERIRKQEREGRGWLDHLFDPFFDTEEEARERKLEQIRMQEREGRSELDRFGDLLTDSEEEARERKLEQIRMQEREGRSELDRFGDLLTDSEEEARERERERNRIEAKERRSFWDGLGGLDLDFGSSSGSRSSARSGSFGGGGGGGGGGDGWITFAVILIVIIGYFLFMAALIVSYALWAFLVECVKGVIAVTKVSVTAYQSSHALLQGDSSELRQELHPVFQVVARLSLAGLIGSIISIVAYLLLSSSIHRYQARFDGGWWRVDLDAGEQLLMLVIFIGIVATIAVIETCVLRIPHIGLAVVGLATALTALYCVAFIAGAFLGFELDYFVEPANPLWFDVDEWLLYFIYWFILIGVILSPITLVLFEQSDDEYARVKAYTPNDGRTSDAMQACAVLGSVFGSPFALLILLVIVIELL